MTLFLPKGLKDVENCRPLCKNHAPKIAFPGQDSNALYSQIINDKSFSKKLNISKIETNRS